MFNEKPHGSHEWWGECFFCLIINLSGRYRLTM